jgi:integrase-like protein
MTKWPSFEEMQKGEKDILLQIQKKHFSHDQKFNSINVLLEDGLLRVKTRLTFKDDWENFKTPILLPNNDILVEQLVNQIHRTFCHAGTQFLLNKLREKYWIVQGRKTVGKIIQKCVICRRFSCKSFLCDPAPLPQNRIETQSAFQISGVDLAGPFIMKGGKKAWAVIFTCAVYRGVHLDWVDSLSANDFIDCFKKFTNTIGRPSTMYSDNVTNFVAAKNLMDKLNWKE